MKIPCRRFVVLALALCGCMPYAPPRVEVVGNPSDLQLMAGTWRGTFRNEQMKRSGKIEFHMSATADSAFGEVTMYMEDPNQPIWTKPMTPPTAPSGPVSRWHRIRFVRVEQGYVSGEMEPMYEPRCACYVIPRFIGRLRGAVTEGSFTSRAQVGTFESSGSWHVKRVAEPSR